MRTSRITMGAATGLTLALTLAACGGDGADAEEPMPDENAQEETETMEEEQDSEDMDEEDGEDSGDSDDHDDMDEDNDSDADLSAVEPQSTGDPFADARNAASHMPMTGETFAAGFTEALHIEGDPQSEAAELRGQLTALFQEHVYLAGIAVATAYHAGPDSDEFALAAETVDENSVALADAVGDLAGDDARESFLRNWREHIDYFVNYAVAAEAGDQEGMDQAVADLTEYADGVGMFFDRTTDGALNADAVTESIIGHIETLAGAVDSLAAGDPAAFANLKAAADHMVMGAATMAEGLSEAADLEGDPNDDASELRSALTANLNEHVYVAGIAVFVGYTEEDGLESEAFEAAAGVVDDNAVQLADAVGGLAGDEQRDPFLDLWRDHIGYFVDYAGAVAEGDDDAAESALMALDAYRSDAGAFFEDISGGELPAEDVEDGLSTHVQTVAGAIDSLNEALVQN
ncbi:hypothetical protein [Nesterenkonia sphaerica]|uniref:Copper amine oxidase n=1 Tax=Nesterenkonia sphaerica TaxID=1804988 RepID=A0A5R9A2Q8_9MICC|nr:hypothetical protein [Nesterenkonia sphaerica]TLP72892.1 hypothetical protein FEF27_11270 [Nesterenkonia sphaerica]